MDFTKIDFAKLDPTKLFDVAAAIDFFEKGSECVLDCVPEQFKKPAGEITKAGFELVRSQHEAFIKFGTVVQKQLKSTV